MGSTLAVTINQNNNTSLLKATPIVMPDTDQTSLLVHQRSHRVTPRISLHSFSTSPGSSLVLQPSQHITLQFPPDLDPILGSRGLSDEDRRMAFTPCRIIQTQDGTVQSLDLLSGNGRVTGLLGLPRPQGLTAAAVDIGGGFPQDLLDDTDAFTCVAGGTGVTGFLAMASSPMWQRRAEAKSCSLLWSIRGDDFPLVEHFLKSGDLDVEAWAAIQIFVTAGEDTSGFVGGKSPSWWDAHFKTLQQQFSQRLTLHTRRITKEDLGDLKLEKGALLFCGSKSLQWQVKMWTLGRGRVYSTDR